MNAKLLAAIIGLLIVASGCVRTVTGEKTGGVPFINDTVQAAYKLPPEAIFAAAKQVIREEGILTNEGTIYEPTNTVKVVQGRVNQCAVWVRIAPVDSQVTSVEVEVRTQGGGSRMALAHEIDKEIAVKLALRPRP
jgi:hypothetical protein